MSYLGFESDNSDFDVEIDTRTDEELHIRQFIHDVSVCRRRVTELPQSDPKFIRAKSILEDLFLVLGGMPILNSESNGTHNSTPNIQPTQTACTNIRELKKRIIYYTEGETVTKHESAAKFFILVQMFIFIHPLSIKHQSKNKEELQSRACSELGLKLYPDSNVNPFEVACSYMQNNSSYLNTIKSDFLSKFVDALILEMFNVDSIKSLTDLLIKNPELNGVFEGKEKSECVEIVSAAIKIFHSRTKRIFMSEVCNYLTHEISYNYFFGGGE